MSSPTSGEDTGNHPVSANAGGASATPTPANNSGGGSGWGDKGFSKGGDSGVAGGGEGLGHTAMPNPAASFGNFLGLQDQKSHAETNAARRLQESAGYEKPTTSSGEETCATEDHSFMNHKPGCPQTLPGTSAVKKTLQRATKYGRGE